MTTARRSLSHRGETRKLDVTTMEWRRWWKIQQNQKSARDRKFPLIPTANPLLRRQKFHCDLKHAAVQTATARTNRKMMFQTSSNGRQCKGRWWRNTHSDLSISLPRANRVDVGIPTVTTWLRCISNLTRPDRNHSRDRRFDYYSRIDSRFSPSETCISLIKIFCFDKFCVLSGIQTKVLFIFMLEFLFASFWFFDISEKKLFPIFRCSSRKARSTCVSTPSKAVSSNASASAEIKCHEWEINK